MTIEVNLSAAQFRSFTIFDVLRRRKQWKGPALFALILGCSAAICYSMSDRQGAVLLGNVLLFIGLGIPCAYFAMFFASLHRQILDKGLSRPQKVYTITLTEAAEGIQASNDREQMTYAWKSVHHAYRALTATYLYLTPERAFILPHTCLEGDADDLWKLITKKLPPEKRTVL